MEFDTGGGRESEEEVSRGSRAGGSGGGGYDLSNPVDSFIATVREIVTQPVGFFRSITRRDGLKSPIAFAMICAFIGALLGGVLAVLASVVGIGNQGIGGAIGGLWRASSSRLS